MSSGAVLLMLAFAMLGPVPAAHAQATVIKLATLVPDGSVWHKVLRDMGDDWTRGTAGRVTLRIYPGGVAGDEPDMVRKMRIGQIQAAALTVAGLADIDDAFHVFAVPMMFDSYPELFAVLDRMQPVLKQRLDQKGFVLLNWGHGGWVYIFSKQPVASLAELKKTKMFVWAGDDRMVQAWKANGFQPVALAATDIMPGLNTGMIDALPTTPLAAASLQWFRQTPYMANAGLGPLVGGLVVTKQAWSRISEADRAAIMKACARAESRLTHNVPAQDSSSVREMQSRGLKVVTVKPADLAAWHKIAEEFSEQMRGAIVPAEMLDMAVRERDAYRKRAAAH
jgi:TRAP-type C4-dicarboxylate transport system substrate-binding protein